ncbi:MAG: hypothetical protein FWF70_00940 [Bacteroidetes bacterium]|nr:hypothetical protein [Bacteroidota bacterium]MCL1968404.1 hypothetical protein [Bacteroidota bacterium]
MKKTLCFIFILAGIFGLLQAQNSITINAAGTGNLNAEASNETFIREVFKSAHLFEDFENITGSGSNNYNGTEVTFAGGVWYIKGLTNMDANDRYNGMRSIRFRGNNTDVDHRAEMMFDKPNGAGTVSFKYGSYSTHSGAVLKLQISTNHGATWQDKGSSIVAPSWTGGGSILQTASIEVNIEGDIRVRIIKISASGNSSVNIDDIEITDFVNIATPIATAATGVSYNRFTANWNLQNEADNYLLSVYQKTIGISYILEDYPAGNINSYTVLNLFPLSTYYYTVKAQSGTFVSEVSNEIEVTTAALPTFTITASAGANGTIEPSGSLTVPKGENQRFTFAAFTGYTVAQLLVNGLNVPDSIAGGRYTFNNVSKNHTISVTFKKECPKQVYDSVNIITYDVIELAGYCWFKQNLRNTKYQDGTPIPFAQPYSFQGNLANEEIFGLLYTWNSAVGMPDEFTYPIIDTIQRICPFGWHIPSQMEWSVLEGYATSQLMSRQYWLDPPGSGSDNYGFSAFPAGYYNSDTYQYRDIYGFAGWWASDAPSGTIANCFYISYYCNNIQKDVKKKKDRLSVRCVSTEQFYPDFW